MGDELILSIPTTSQNTPELCIELRVGQIGDVRLSCLLACGVPAHKRQSMLQTLNDLHGRFRYITLNMDEAGDVSVTYDFILWGNDEEALFKQTVSIWLLFADALDEVTLPVMSLIWPKDTEGGEG